MTAPVRIDASAWGDLRFATLARLCGFADAEHALIKCAKIWSWQTEHYTDEATTYVVEVDIVESALGPGGAAHLVRARLAEEGPDGLRIRGSKGRIEWLWKNRNASKRGGDATRRKHADKEGPSGLPPAQPSARPDPRPETGPLTPDLSPFQGSQITHTRVRERPAGAGLIARNVWSYGLKAANSLIAAKIQVPAWSLMPDASHPAWIALLDRVCELLVSEPSAEAAEDIAKNRIDVAAAKVRAEPNEAHWFSASSMFTTNSFETWARLDPAQFARKPAKKRAEGSAIGSASPRSDFGDASKPAKEAF